MPYINGISRVTIGLISNARYHGILKALGGNIELPSIKGRLLGYICVTSPVDINICAGTVANGTDILDNILIPANTPTTLNIGYFFSAPGTVYFSNLVLNTIIEYYKF